MQDPASPTRPRNGAASAPPDEAAQPPVQGGWRRGLMRGAPGATSHGSSWTERHWSSRALHRIGEVTSHAGAGLCAAALVLVWAAVGLQQSFPDWWETVLYSATASTTFVMVFAIQHTQTRQQLATQRKLDEIIRAMSTADDRLIAVEEAPDEELEALADSSLADRETAIS